MLFTPIKPMLISSGKELSDDDIYVNEIKWDGWRILLHKDGDKIEAFTRTGRRVTNQFPELNEISKLIKSKSAIIDCEDVCIRDGRSVFDDFTYRGRLTDPFKIERATVTHAATFVAFDVLQTDGRDHTMEPLLERKARLSDLIEPSPILLPTVFMLGNASELKHLTEIRNMEGIVSKKKDSNYYVDTRTDEWLKFKNWKTIDCVILGYRLDPQFQLVVGLHFKTMRNKPVAIVDYGMKLEEKKAFLAVAKQIHTHSERGTQWIEPKLCCRIQYLDRTDHHNLRTVTFKGFLFDKLPEDCKWVS